MKNHVYEISGAILVLLARAHHLRGFLMHTSGAALTQMFVCRHARVCKWEFVCRDLQLVHDSAVLAEAVFPKLSLYIVQRDPYFYMPSKSLLYLLFNFYSLSQHKILEDMLNLQHFHELGKFKSLTLLLLMKETFFMICELKKKKENHF